MGKRNYYTNKKNIGVSLIYFLEENYDTIDTISSCYLSFGFYVFVSFFRIPLKKKVLSRKTSDPNRLGCLFNMLHLYRIRHTLK